MPNLGLTTASVGTLANKIIEGRKFMLRRILLITESVAAVTPSSVRQHGLRTAPSAAYPVSIL